MLLTICIRKLLNWLKNFRLEAFDMFDRADPLFSISFPEDSTDPSIAISARTVLNTILNSVCTTSLATALKETSYILQRLVLTDAYENAFRLNFRIPFLTF